MFHKHLLNNVRAKECLNNLSGNYKILTHRHYFAMSMAIYTLVFFIMFIIAVKFYQDLKNNKKDK